MYEQHFNLTQSPFQLSPHNDIFYASKGHKKAYSYLEYGIGKKEGFIVITGEVGAGKTTLIEHLFANIHDDDLISARLAASQFNSSEILTIIADALRVITDGQSKAKVSLALNRFLGKCVERNKHVLIVVDEAQNIPLDALEELRMITNFTHHGEAPVQIFLLGQPEFRDTLNSPKLEQLRQRVVARYHLGPLSEAEVSEYVNYRINMVNSLKEPQFLFDEEVFPLVYEASGGIPRIINTLCDRCLISAFLEEQDHVSLETANEVISELEEEHSHSSSTEASKPKYEAIVEEVDFLI